MGAVRESASHALCLSTSPLSALRIDLRECETFFLGTASKNGGKSSSKDCRPVFSQLKGVGANAAGSNAADIALVCHGSAILGKSVRVL